MTPPTVAPAVIATSTTAGCICTVRLWITGWSTLPSSICTRKITSSVQAAITTPRSARATSTASTPETNAPRYGMYAPMKTSAPSPAAPGTPRRSRPMVVRTPSIRAIMVVPRMNPSTAR